MIFVIFILLLGTLPLWLSLLFRLLTIPLEILTFIGEIGVSIFGEGNGALLLIILMLMFFFFLKWIVKFLDKKDKK
jgi:hypothetical protein